MPNFAKSVVNTCLRIQHGDRVVIHAWPHMLDLAEAFALECEKIGAKTHLELVTDKLYYQSILDLPLDYVREANPFSLSMLDVATACIFIAGPEDPEHLKKITPERMKALVEGDKPYSHKYFEKKIRSANVYLGYVTRQRAKTYGFDYEKWKRSVQAAIDVDYDSIRESGRKVGKMIEEASIARITAGNGTDLTLKLGNAVAHIDDGIIDDDDFQKGFTLTALPAGTIAVLPKEGSANGVFISDMPEPDSGLLIQNLTWKFRSGHLTSFTGGKNVEAIRSRWKIAKGERDEASLLMIGLNPRARKGFLQNSIVLGSITLGIGDNRELGGKIESDFGAKCTVSNPSLELDERLVIRNGRFLI